MKTEIQFLEPADVPDVHAMCEAQSRRDGLHYAPPEIFVWRDKWIQSVNVPVALKLVRDGRMVQAYTFERRLEFSSYGTDPRATAAALRELPQAMMLLAQMGYTGFHAAVPQSFVDQWERSLGRRLHMQRDDERLAHFYRGLAVRANPPAATEME